MTGIARSLDMLLSGLAALIWGLATFVIVSRLFSGEVGGLLGLAVALSGLAFVLSSHLGEQRVEKLMAGVCPGCGVPIEADHQHCRWDPGLGRWLDAITSWDCAKCGYSHSEEGDCPACAQRVD